MCSWIKVKVLPQVGDYGHTGDDDDDDDDDDDAEGEFGDDKVVLSDLAITIIRQWGEVFCGFGAYSVQEVVFRAGLCSPKCVWLGG